MQYPIHLNTPLHRVFNAPIPLALYIHFPWCVRKCPYCDFNSHQSPDALPEDAYVQALIQDLTLHLPQIWGRPIHSIFMGGGTPSLFSPRALEQLFSQLFSLLNLSPQIEITLEANPGRSDFEKFKGYRELGINRLSIGIQSFEDTHLATLGRIHDSNAARAAIHAAQEAGFDNFNLDLMFGLPGQSVAQGLQDLQTALSFNPTHLSWYELTLEPNTPFYHKPPVLPTEPIMENLFEEGQSYLHSQGFRPYEVSAYTANKPSRHNLNYWQFGDYLGIGAGAHSKITDVNTRQITRIVKHKHPKAYLQAQATEQFIQESTQVPDKDLPFEFMLNLLRLEKGFDKQLFLERTGLPWTVLTVPLAQATDRGLILETADTLSLTELGRRFRNDVIDLFLPQASAS